MIKMIRLHILLSMLFSMIVVSSYAQFGGGAGTSASPYLISSVLHLNNIRGTAYLGKYYRQTADLNLEVTNPANVSDWVSGNTYNVGDYVKYSPGATQYTYICIQATSSEVPTNTAYWTQMWESAKGWKPIGDATNPFHGVYDGNDKTIANLYINRGASAVANNVYPSDGEDNVGLFGFVANGSSTTVNNYHVYIKKLGMLNPNVTGRRATGSLVGKVLLPNTLPARSYTVYIEQCYAKASGSGTATVRGFGATGGLVGANNSDAKQRVPVVRLSWAYVTVSATHPNNYAPNPNDTIGSTGISNPYNIKYGGLVGCNENGVTQDSFARGNVSGGDRVGGLGGCTIGGAIFRSYSTGTVTRNIQPGGSLPNYEGGIGGLVGRTSGSLPPGLGGTVQTGSCEDCFWDTVTSGFATSPGGTGKNTTQMKTQSTFTNWDFTNIWKIEAGINDGYPFFIGSPSSDFYYRTKQTGNWNATGTWLYSANNVDWYDAVVTPDRANSISILVRNGHTVTVTQHVIVDATTIEETGQVTISSGNSLDVSNGIGTDLTVNGKLMVTGVFTVEINSNVVFGPLSELIYNGNIAQETGTYFVDDITNLTVDNPNGLTLTNNVVVTKVLSVLNGNYTQGSGIVVDTDGVYSPTVKYFTFPATGYGITNYAASVSNPSLFPEYVDRQWSINGYISDPTAQNRSKTITFYWTAADDFNTDWSNQVPVVYAGSTPLNRLSYTTGNPRTVTVEYTFSQSKDTIKIGFEDEVLPVQLSSFNAVINANNVVQLQWTTQTETNNLGFVVYRSMQDDLANATPVSALIEGTNTSQIQNYVYRDHNLEDEGLYYYWLESRNIDGSNMFYGPVSVTYDYPDAVAPDMPLVQGINNVYPNPFNPSTTISFSITKDSQTSLVIYNHRGQMVRTLTDKFLPKGQYKVSWDGRDERGQSCSSGIYYMRMVSGKESSNRKLVLMK